ncbi:MAG: hypothetical protein AAGG75_17595 [Bacteroidota bacterium]
MLYSRIRLVLIVLFFALGLILHIQLGLESAFYLYIAGILLLITHFLFGNIPAAFSHLKRGKLDQAEALIKQVRRPNWLIKRHRAYYHFVKGMIALQREKLPESEVDLSKALEIGLKSETDNALTALNLAHICYVKNRHEESREYLKTAKTHPNNDLLIKQHIEELEKVLATPYN